MKLNQNQANKRETEKNLSLHESDSPKSYEYQDEN